MNSKKFGSRVKGFTLIEMIVVMAIIAILSGISSMLITGFQRDARMEANDNKAQIVYTGMQNQVIQCEMKQDDGLFDINKNLNSSNPGYVEKNAYYVELYFQMESAKVSDRIVISTTYKNGSSITVESESVERNSADADMKKWYTKLENAILSFVDSSFEGFCAVYIDYDNYTVDSVIYVENAFFDGDLSSYAGVQSFMKKFDNYADTHCWTDANKVFRMLNDTSKQVDCIEIQGIYFGAYPVADDYKVKPAII